MSPPNRSGLESQSWVLMDIAYTMLKFKFGLLIFFAVICLYWTWSIYIKLNTDKYPAKTHWQILISDQTITPIKDTKHLMVSAYKDHRVDGAIRIISIIRRGDLQPLHCFFCGGHGCFPASVAQVEMHSDHFGFPFVTTDVLCQSPSMYNVTHVTISIHSDIKANQNQHFLSIQNKELREEKIFPYNFTVCISNLFGGYNNVLQFVQTMEMYKLLGVQRVVIYNTSCGQDLEPVLVHYREEGILEIVEWPIDQFLNPSKGWRFEEHKGDLHYYGQLTTLNECIYRYMYQSKYVLLHDIDEIVMPYQHANLHLLLEDLQYQHPRVGVFVIENHIFPKNHYEDSGKFKLPQWREIPGINILEHIYREPSREAVINPTKLIVNPRHVVQTSVHSVLKTLGETFWVPPDVCRLIHVRVPLQGSLTKDQLLVDKKLWEYEKELVQNVDNTLRKSGLLL